MTFTTTRRTIVWSPVLTAIALFAILMVPIPRIMSAQELRISATIGVYAPMVDVFSTSAGQVRKNTTDVYAGLRVGIAGLGRFGVEGSVGFSPSDATMKNNPGFPDIKFDDRVLLGSIKATFDVLQTDNSRMFLAGGGAVILREEEHLGLMNSFESVTSYGIVLGAGWEFDVSDNLALRADVEDYIYSVGLPDSVQGQASFNTQHDLVLSVGLAIMIPL